MKSTANKREREKRMVSEMIALYCRKNITPKAAFAPNAQSWNLMPGCAATSARLWRPKPFAPTARCIATNRLCGRKSGKSCGFLTEDVVFPSGDGYFPCNRIEKEKKRLEESR